MQSCDTSVVVCTAEPRRRLLKAANSRGWYVETFLLQVLLVSSFSQFFVAEENISADLSEAE